MILKESTIVESLTNSFNQFKTTRDFSRLGHSCEHQILSFAKPIEPGNLSSLFGKARLIAGHIFDATTQSQTAGTFSTHVLCDHNKKRVLFLGDTHTFYLLKYYQKGYRHIEKQVGY